MNIDEFGEALRATGEATVAGNRLRAPGPGLGRVLAQHLAGLFPPGAEIAYGFQTSELAAQPHGWEGTTEWYLVIGCHILYVSVSIAPNQSGGSRASGRHELRRIESISKIDVETSNSEIGGLPAGEAVTVTVTFPDGKTWHLKSDTRHLQPTTLRRLVAELTRVAPVT